MRNSAEWVESELRLRFDLGAMSEDQVREARVALFEEWVEVNQQRLLIEARELDRRSRPNSMVYFAQDNATKAVKIGTSERVRNRARALARPGEIIVLAVVPGSYRVESWVHHRFEHARISGEWFRPVTELMEYISRIS